ncbi:MAG: S41 family peptidase [Polyangiaceae bacterium]
MGDARRTRALWIAVALVPVASFGVVRAVPDPAALPARAAIAPALVGFPVEAEPGVPFEDAEEGDDPRALVLPTGKLPSLSCREARKVVKQARDLLAVEPGPIDVKRFAAATSEWLDPHGLWSVAPDAPVATAISKRAKDLLADLEADPARADSPGCASAEAVGETLAAWVGGLRKTAREARDLAREARPLPTDPRVRWDALAATPFQDGVVTRDGHDLARLIGFGAGMAEAIYGEPLRAYADTAIDRTVPDLSAKGWSEVLLAASVRAYVPEIDPHGAWAPVDEETSIYDLALEVDPPPRLWTEMTRTIAGVRVDQGAYAPLRDGDVVLEAAGVTLAGLSVEQANQLAYVKSGGAEQVVVMRRGEVSPLSLEIVSAPGVPTGDSGGELVPRWVSFGDGVVAVIPIADVPDDLGERLGEARKAAREPKGPTPARLVGVLLDLRGNGGGSTDGAMAAIGEFLPGAPTFPMKRRDGTIEVDRAPFPRSDQVWAGPLAVLVDGESASAAEMIAGGLASYRRAALLGSKTYGKGCAQEYLDDDSQRGVLRLTTLMFSLPDGSPLQRVGLAPSIALGLGPGPEREAFLPHSLPPWRGPDVRDPELIRDVDWPDSAGRVGPCEDEQICAALRSLGSCPRAAAR